MTDIIQKIALYSWILLATLLLTKKYESIPSRFLPLNKRRKKLNIYDFVAVLCILCFAIFCATRSLLNTFDTEAYYRYYWTLADGNIRCGTFENGYKIINLISIYVFHLSFSSFLFLTCFINVGAIYFIFRFRYNNAGIALYFYLFLIGFYYNYIVLRQGIAFTFIFLAFSYFNKSRIKMFFWLLVATLFHKTVFILMIVVFILQYIKLNQVTLLILWAIAFLNYLTGLSTYFVPQLFEAFCNIIPESWKIVLVDHGFNVVTHGVERSYVLNFILSGIVIIFYKYLTKNKLNNFLCVANVFGLIVLSLLERSFTITIRFTDYFIYCSLIILLVDLSKVKLVKIVSILLVPYYKLKFILGYSRLFF